MPLVFAAAMGGNLSLIGAPGNMIAQSALEPLGLKFGFFEYAIVGLPILVCGILFYATVGFRLLPNHETTDDGASVFDDQKDFSKVPQWKKTLSLVILVATLAAMIFEDQIGIKLCISGCVGAILLILTGVISEKEALRSIDLKTIFLFGGTLSLAAALQDTGAGEMIAGKVIGALGSNPSPLIFTFVVFILCCVMTNFMSNTATTALMAPICLSIAQGMGADPRAVLMACVIGGSCAYATPIGMPANTMVVGAGGYKFMDYVKSGLPLIIIATVVSMIILPIAFPFYP
jgi:anion transporter